MKSLVQLYVDISQITEINATRMQGNSVIKLSSIRKLTKKSTNHFRQL